MCTTPSFAFDRQALPANRCLRGDGGMDFMNLDEITIAEVLRDAGY